MAKTKDNKELFKVCTGVLGAELKKYGYLPHPAYQPGWEASNQEYVCNWLKEDVSQGIDEISMTLNPKGRLIRISRSLVNPELPEGFAFSDISSDPFEYNYFLINPYIRFTLLPHPRRFWHFRKLDLKISNKEATDTEEAKNSLAKYVLPCLPDLVLAKDRNIKNKSIAIDTFGITVKNA